MKTTTPYLFKHHHSLTISIPKLAPHQLSQACFRLDELVEASKSCTVHIQILFADVFHFHIPRLAVIETKHSKF